VSDLNRLKVSDLNRIECPTSTGLGIRPQSDWVSDLSRNLHDCTKEVREDSEKLKSRKGENYNCCFWTLWKKNAPYARTGFDNLSVFPPEVRFSASSKEFVGKRNGEN